MKLGIFEPLKILKLYTIKIKDLLTNMKNDHIQYMKKTTNSTSQIEYD